MVAIEVMAITPKGEEVLKSDKVNKMFDIGSAKRFLMRKTSDIYTTTSISKNPYTILVEVKPEYSGFINMHDTLLKTQTAIRKILEAHGGRISDVSICIKE